MSLLIFVMPSLFAGKQADIKSLFSKNSVSNRNVKRSLFQTIKRNKQYICILYNIFQKMSSDKTNKQPLFEQQQVKNAKQIMRPFVLRRLKAEVLCDLPEKTDEVIRCTLTKKQDRMYKNLVEKFSVEANENTEVNGVGMMMQLRKLANHPLLVRDYYKETQLKVNNLSLFLCISHILYYYIIFSRI